MTAPARLALQTGRLDDHRRDIEPHDELWRLACRCYLDSDEVDGAPRDDDDVRALCERWPAREGPPGQVEAIAVTVALASPFAGRDRVLAALAAHGAAPDAAEQQHRPVLVSPWAVSRPRFPHVYDPDSEERAPIIAVLDGPRSREVAELLNAIKMHDETLAEAIVLGADLETLEMLDRLSVDARRAGRSELAAQVEQDKARWRQRADQARARQRLEGSHYGWHSDNLPPGCLEAARAENRHQAEALLEQPPPAPG